MNHGIKLVLNDSIWNISNRRMNSKMRQYDSKNCDFNNKIDDIRDPHNFKFTLNISTRIFVVWLKFWWKGLESKQ